MKLGVIGRFKPLHLGGATMLEELCNQAEHVVIGIGSSNKYNVRNPFTAEESEGMVRALLGERNYSLLHVPDFAHIPEFSDGKKWHDYVVDNFGELDTFVSGNKYVFDLLSDVYQVVHPADLIPVEKHIQICGTEVRVSMAKHEDWQSLISPSVADYLVQNNLVTRFRQEFGLQTLTYAGIYRGSETSVDEYQHTREK